VIEILTGLATPHCLISLVTSQSKHYHMTQGSKSPRTILQLMQPLFCMSNRQMLFVYHRPLSQIPRTQKIVFTILLAHE